jgi:hypothetical protein
MMRKGRHRSQTTNTCLQGHEYTPENTMVIDDAKGWKRCRECMRKNAREYMRRRRAQQREEASNGT